MRGFCPIVCAKTTKPGPVVPPGGTAFDRQLMQGLRHLLEQQCPAADMAQFVREYGKTTEPAQPDGRLDAPTFHRNHEPIWSAIGGFLAAQSGDLLEVGS